ncbi:hypothetical protein OS493_038593 [Desmophyllum pertusum]|uniref:Uncharacterized protein n=1 Tax=Desmophyllum pertusum TaxID=174260 RepID=A0A9W9YHE6_9CNID|nr:hypothetical protein OS493_038593 [Desmophyllum pertusum]
MAESSPLKVTEETTNVALGLDQQEIDRLKTEPIDHDTQRRVKEEVNKWKHQFESRMQDVERRQDDSDQRQDNFEDRISTMEEKLPKVAIHELSSRLSDDVPHVYGRSKETDEVVEAIQSGEEAVVLITGGPGFGKTTVAKRAARSHGRTCEQPQLQENPQLWLQNWSKQLKGNVTFVLDNADDVLDRDNAVYTEEALIKCLKQGPLDVLQSNRRPTVDTSVEKSIMTSFEALKDCEMQALILLCSFPGSFDTEAAKVLIAPCLPTTAEGPQVVILTELIDRCLVEKPSPKRYEIHSLIQAAAKKIGRERYPQLLD